MSMDGLIEVGMINLAINLALQIGHFLRTLVHQEQDEHDLRMIYPDRFRNFLEQNRFAHPRRRHDQPALPASERRQKIDRARADRIRLRILQHDPALRELRSQLVEICRLGPLLHRFSFDRRDLIEREQSLPVARQTERPRQPVAGAQMKLLNDRARHTNILGHRQKIQFRITKQSE